MPTELAEQLRAWLAVVAREEVAKALAEATGHVPLDLMSTAEAAALARVSPGTLRRWIREGRLQACGAGRDVRVRRRDLEGLMRAGGKRQPPRANTQRARAVSPEEQALRDLGIG